MISLSVPPNNRSEKALDEKYGGRSGFEAKDQIRQGPRQFLLDLKPGEIIMIIISKDNPPPKKKNEKEPNTEKEGRKGRRKMERKEKRGMERTNKDTDQ